MRRKNKKIICLMLVILTILLIILMVCIILKKPYYQNKNADQKEMQISLLKREIDLGEGLKLTDVSETTGEFPEDGSDELVEKMLMATFVNEGENTIQYSAVKITIGEEVFSFEFSTLPAGKSVCVFEANKKSLSSKAGEVSAKAEYIAYFQEEPSLYKDQLEITVADGTIKVRNISGREIKKEISVFYKNVSGDTFIGGITYRFRVPAGLADGEEYQGSAVHVSEKMTKVMFVTYGE